MRREALLKALAAQRGPVMVEIANMDDVFWVQAVKADVMHVIRMKFNPGEETGFELDSRGFLGKDFLCADD